MLDHNRALATETTYGVFVSTAHKAAQQQGWRSNAGIAAQAAVRSHAAQRGVVGK